MENEEYSSRPGELTPAQPHVPARQNGSALASWEMLGGDSAPSSGGAPMLQRYLAAVLRHKWLILLLVLVGTTAGAFAAQYLPQQYQAQATIWISAQQSNDRSGPIRSNELLDSNAWIELLRSYVVLDNVVRSERLYLQPASPADSLIFADFTVADRFRPGSYRLNVDGRSYVLQTQEGIRIESGQLGGPIGQQLGFQWQPAPRLLRGRSSIDFKLAVPREAAVDLNQALMTRIDPGANFLRIELRRPTGEEAARVLNAVTERYVEVAAELKRSRVQELSNILQEQLAYAEQNLRQAEAALESFRVATVTLPSDRVAITPGLQMTENPVYDGFFEMKVEQEQLRRDRAAIERALAAAQDSALSTTALEMVTPVTQSSELVTALKELNEMRAEYRALRYRYTDEHPPVQRLAANIATMEQVTIPRMARAVIEQIDARQQVLAGLIGNTASEMQEIPQRSIEEARLARNVAIAENLYTSLQTRAEEARLSVASTTPDIQILDEAAVPLNPVSEQKAMVILLGFAGSLGLGILGAILRERIDRTIRYPDQLASGLGLPVLGAVPFLAPKKNRDESMAQATEAFRSLRLNVANAHGRGPLVVTISSPGAGDGKSFVTSNLAVSFADLGLRTIIVDGDVRKGIVHRLVERPRTPGLTDFLAGDVPLQDAVQTTSYEKLHVITSGTRSRTSPELLDSREMRRLIMELRTRYDVVLVDSSPLGAGVDPFVLGTITGALVLVVRTGTTRQDFTEAKLNLLARLPVRLLGAVMNGIDSTQNNYYNYYSYLPGYTAADESENPTPELQKA